jgi:hypothetical protein
VIAAEGGEITVTVAEAGAEVHPFVVTVNDGAKDPVLLQLTFTGPADVLVEGVAVAPKFQL